MACRATLRDLFWLTLLMAIGIGWGLERYRATHETKRVDSFWVVERKPTDPNNFRRRTLARLRSLPEGELIAEFQDFPGNRRHDDEYSCLISEMARRKLQKELKLEYDHQQCDQDWRRGYDNLNLLTALRRAQGQPDPLKIHVSFKSATEILAVVENVDAEREEFVYTSGCDDRSGRRTRWRIQLTDEKGVRVDDSNFDQIHIWGMGGGIGSFGPLKHGQKDDWPKDFDIRKYVSPPASGVYTMRVVHSNEHIASESDLDGLIVWQSDPIRVRVTNRMSHETRGLSPMVFGVILLTTCCSWAVSAVWCRWRPRATTVSRNSLTYHDLLALLLLIALTVGWQVDSWHLSSRFEGVRADDEANWSIEPMECSASSQLPKVHFPRYAATVPAISW